MEPSALAEGNNGQQTGGVSSGGIAGIVIGVLLGVAALGILIAFFVVSFDFLFFCDDETGC